MINTNKCVHNFVENFKLKFLQLTNGQLFYLQLTMKYITIHIAKMYFLIWISNFINNYLNKYTYYHQTLAQRINFINIEHFLKVFALDTFSATLVLANDLPGIPNLCCLCKGNILRLHTQ